MTYNFRIGLRPQWYLASEGDKAGTSLHDVLALLAAIEAEGHIAGACKSGGLSYRHGWGLLRRFEASFGTALVRTRRRQGSELTPFAQRLLWANRRIEARLAPTLESLASELQEELQRLLPQERPALRLQASHGFAVEALMQRGAGVELRYRNAAEALASLARGDCDLAGFQLPQGEFERDILAHYAQWLDREAHMLVQLAVRNTGFFVRAGNPKGIRGVADLARPDVRFVNRQMGPAPATWSIFCCSAAASTSARCRASRPMNSRIWRLPPTSPAAWPTWAWAWRPRRGASDWISSPWCRSAISLPCAGPSWPSRPCRTFCGPCAAPPIWAISAPCPVMTRAIAAAS